MLYRLPVDDRAANGAAYTDTTWRLLISDANSAYRRDNTARARALYDDALAEAQMLYEAAYWADVEAPVAVLYVISCHNRADLARIEGDMERASIEAVNAYDRLVATAEDPMAPLALRKGAVQNLGKVLAYLAQLAKEAPEIGGTLEAQVNRARHAAFAVFKIAEHSEHADATCGHCSVFQ